MKKSKALVAVFFLAVFGLSFYGCSKDTDQFVGVYVVEDECGQGEFTHGLTITASSNKENTIVMENLAGASLVLIGTVSGNSLTIPNQNVTVQSNTFSIEGNGTINGDVLTYSYTVSSTTGNTSCNANATKQ